MTHASVPLARVGERDSQARDRPALERGDGIEDLPLLHRGVSERGAGSDDARTGRGDDRVGSGRVDERDEAAEDVDGLEVSAECVSARARDVHEPRGTQPAYEVAERDR